MKGSQDKFERFDSYIDSNMYRCLAFILSGLLLYSANYNNTMPVLPEFNEEDKCNIDEVANPLGNNRCTNNNQCLGDRTCSFSKWCTGISNCKNQQSSSANDDCGHDEGLNVNGPNRCTDDSECDGNRTCAYNKWCTGNSGC